MACIQYPRKERGGVSLPSYEKVTILREPPKEIFTRKKERVEEGDVTFNIRNDASRYNDAISNWQKGKNMMVKVDYQNRAPQTTTMNFGSASNPYKVNQSFRPPEFSLLDLQPLSRQKRPYVAGQTNIGSQITRNDSSEIRMDQREIDFSIGANPTLHTANTNVSREMGIYYDNHDRTDAIHTDMSFYELMSSLKGVELVDLQKLFSIEQTPYGIVLTPLVVKADAVLSGPSNVEPHRYMNTSVHVQDQVNYQVSTNESGYQDVEAQRHLSNLISYLQDHISAEQGTNKAGISQFDSQRHIHQDVYIRSDGLLAYIGTNTSGPYQDGNYELDTNGYIAEPLRVETSTNLSSQADVGVPMISADGYIMERSQIGQGANLSSMMKQDGNPILTDGFIMDRAQIGQGVNQMGIKQYESQRNVSDIMNYLQDQLQTGIGTNVKGQVTVESQRTLSDVLSFLKEELVVGKGTNISSQIGNVEDQRHLSNLLSYLENYAQVGLGTNHQGKQFSSSYEHQDKMKEILLKNMTSAIHIVIQKAGSADEYQIQGNIQDKIGIVVDSTKGGHIQLMGENGQPIRVKDYTWKFVKSAMGGDKFIIQLASDSELELERKGELYAVYSNPYQPIADIEPQDIHLRRNATNITVLTNVELQGNNDRMNESQLQRVEKQTHYTDYKIYGNEPSFERTEHTLDSIRSIQSDKKQRIQQTILAQSEGRFD